MSIHIGWPQGIMLTVQLLSLASSARSAKTKAEVFGNLLGQVIQFGLLYWGGFY